MAVVFNLPTTVTPIPHGRSPEPRRRETIGLPPRRDQPTPLGRSKELELIARAVADRVHTIVTGPPNVGKSTLINEVARRQHADGQPVVFLDVAGQSVDDALQQVFEACYHSESYKPGRGQLRELLADIDFRLVIDHLTCRPQEWASLLHAVPQAVVIAAMPPGDLPADPLRLIQLEGLDRDTALTLIGQRTGVEIGPQNIEAADAVWRATGGLPGRLLLAAAAATCGPGGSLVFPPVETLPQQTLDRLSAPEREIVTLLALGGMGGVAPQLLTELVTTPENMDGALDWLTMQGLVTTGERGFRLLSGVADRLPSSWHSDPSDAERITGVLTSWVGSPGTPSRAVADHATLINAVLDLATSADDQARAARLAQAASSALAVSLRYGAWGDVLAHGLAASRAARDQATEAYLAHEAGVQHLGSGTPEQAARPLTDAASIWDRLGAADRADAARGNLARNGLQPLAPAPVPRLRLTRIAVLLTAVLVAIIVVVVAVTGTGGGPVVSSNKTVARVGDSITVSGSGFKPGETVFLFINWGGVQLCHTIGSPTAGSDGSFSVPVRITDADACADADTGYLIEAQGQTSDKTASTSLTIAAPASSPTLNSPSNQASPLPSTSQSPGVHLLQGPWRISGSGVTVDVESVTRTGGTLTVPVVVTSAGDVRGFSVSIFDQQGNPLQQAPGSSWIDPQAGMTIRNILMISINQSSPPSKITLSIKGFFWSDSQRLKLTFPSP